MEYIYKLDSLIVTPKFSVKTSSIKFTSSLNDLELQDYLTKIWNNFKEYLIKHLELLPKEDVLNILSIASTLENHMMDEINSHFYSIYLMCCEYYVKNMLYPNSQINVQRNNKTICILPISLDFLSNYI